MDSKIPSSFIPKESIKSGLRSHAEPAGILTIISLFLLAGSLIYVASIYAYRYVVYNQINRPCTAENGNGSCGLKESLAAEERDLDRGQLEHLKRLDTKLKNGQTVLDKHTTMAPFFDLLSQLTVQNIQYNKFQFDKAGIVLSGIAKSSEDIAYQQKLLATDPAATKKISSFAFSDFDLDNKGFVSFKLTMTVNRSLLSYVNNNLAPSEPQP